MTSVLLVAFRSLTQISARFYAYYMVATQIRRTDAIDEIHAQKSINVIRVSNTVFNLPQAHRCAPDEVGS